MHPGWFVPLWIFTVTLAYGVGAYVGQSGIRELGIKLRAHERVLVHEGAVQRTVYEADYRQIRDLMNAIDRRLERLEDGRR